MHLACYCSEYHPQRASLARLEWLKAIELCEKQKAEVGLQGNQATKPKAKSLGLQFELFISPGLPMG